VTILLEELHAAAGVEYDAWNVSIFNLEQFSSGFVAINPNSKIPSMADHDFTPPLRVFESGHILKVYFLQFLLGAIHNSVSSDSSTDTRAARRRVVGG
jgi:hypothetical protein